MTGLEPHPILQMPSGQEMLAMGPARLDALRLIRKERMELERDDPFRFGYEPPIWHVVDDLLVEGKRVCLLDYPGVIPTEIARTASREQFEVVGRSEILINGSNRSSKSEKAGKKCMQVLTDREDARGWSFADTEAISIARQQPIFARYMPAQLKRQMTAGGGKLREGATTKIGYSQATGFTGQTFVLPNRSQQWFKNYKQNPADMEGDQLDVIWLDELRDPELLKTLRVRLGDRAGLLIVTFTSIDENYTAIVNEYDKGARSVLEVAAELLPIRKLRSEVGKLESGKVGNATDLITVGFEKVPRVKVAGPGSDGNQRANMVYFHITDNPYYGFTAKPKPGERPLYGKGRFYALWRGATRTKILSRVYGILSRTSATQCPKFDTRVHVIAPHLIPKTGTNYHIADPVAGRNWFMIWVRVNPNPIVRPDGSITYKRYVYREWPSYGHRGLSAYVPGVGELGAWALPGKPADGERGPAQTGLGWGLDRYKIETLRLEGKELSSSEVGRWESGKVGNVTDLGGERLKRPWMHNPLYRRPGSELPEKSGEEIAERRMDSRYGATPTQTNEHTTTLIEQMSTLGMEFVPASGKDIGEGVQMINDALDYDEAVPLGTYSPALGRINEPLLHVSEECPNLIYALREWTGIDKGHGACKDPIDTLRYGFEGELEPISEDAFSWQGGRAA